MKLAIVVPRYGDEVVGGAEYAVRMLAERLVARPEHDVEVEVLTTRAIDSRTWANEYPDGDRTERGVEVRRFSASGRSADFDAVSAPLLAHPEAIGRADESRWLELQGPVSEPLLEAVRESRADLLVFTPYLFHPTVRGLEAVAERAVLHPAAHDEAVLRLPMYRSIFAGARGIVFYTHAEQRLVWSRFPVAPTPQIVLGLGFDERTAAVDAARGTARARRSTLRPVPRTGRGGQGDRRVGPSVRAVQGSTSGTPRAGLCRTGGRSPSRTSGRGGRRTRR